MIASVILIALFTADFSNLQNRAREFLKYQDYENAFTALDSLVKMDSSNCELKVYLAICAKKVGNGNTYSKIVDEMVHNLRNYATPIRNLCFHPDSLIGSDALVLASFLLDDKNEKIDIFTHSLQSKSALVKKTTLECLSFTGLSSHIADNIIGILNSDKDPMVQISCCYALANIKSPGVLPCYFQILNGKLRFLKYAALDALNEVGLPIEDSILGPLLGDSGNLVRLKAVEAFQNHRETKYWDKILSLIDDPDPRVRIAALKTISKTGDSLGVLQLKKRYDGLAIVDYELLVLAAALVNLGYGDCLTTIVKALKSPYTAQWALDALVMVDRPEFSIILKDTMASIAFKKAVIDTIRDDVFGCIKGNDPWSFLFAYADGQRSVFVESQIIDSDLNGVIILEDSAYLVIKHTAKYNNDDDFIWYEFIKFYSGLQYSESMPFMPSPYSFFPVAFQKNGFLCPAWAKTECIIADFQILEMQVRKYFNPLAMERNFAVAPFILQPRYLTDTLFFGPRYYIEYVCLNRNGQLSEGPRRLSDVEDAQNAVRWYGRDNLDRIADLELGPYQSSLLFRFLMWGEDIQLTE